MTVIVCTGRSGEEFSIDYFSLFIFLYITQILIVSFLSSYFFYFGIAFYI